MSIRSSEAIVLPAQFVASLSTAHASVIGLNLAFPRFPTMRVPGAAELSCVGAYRPRCVESASAFPRSVASRLRCVKERCVASASPVERSVACLLARVPECRVPPSCVASALQASPKVALAPALQSLRRAAQANKCERIAGRFARLAAGRPRQQLQ